MADASGRIDLAAPLLSVRRHGGAGAEDTGMAYGEPDDAAPGGVPFRWEHRPGHPKSVRTRRARPMLPTAHDEAALAVTSFTVPEEAARFSDALSQVDSCFTVNCSVSGLSVDAGAPPSARGSVMMDRFLLAAKAVAVRSPHPQRTFRKTTGASTQEPARPAPANARTSDGDSFPRRLHAVEPEHLPANHVPSNTTKEDMSGYDDGEWDVHSTAGFASRRCGLLPGRCVKTTLLLLNPAQAMRRARRGRRLLHECGRVLSDTNPLLRRRRKEEQLEHDATMQTTWEEVYINSLLLRSDRGCLKPAATMTSELGRTVRALYTNQGECVHPKATHLGLLLVLDRSDDDEHRGYHCSSAQSFPEAGETASLLPPKCSGPAKVKTGGGKRLGPDAVEHGFPPPLEEKSTASREIVPWAQPVLALPKPKSPSESWLSRALPSVSSKPPATSFLGIHVQQPRKLQAPSPSWCSSDTALALDHSRPRQIRVHDWQK